MTVATLKVPQEFPKGPSLRVSTLDDPAPLVSEEQLAGSVKAGLPVPGPQGQVPQQGPHRRLLVHP